MTFQELNLIEPILKALTDEGYEKPTPIQAKAIPLVLEKRDLLGCAQTGTGKTAAFAIPMLQLLEANPANSAKGKRPIKALILTPTRELAIQIEESFKAYGKHTRQRCAVIFGGVSQKAQTDKLNAGVDILVATPGRLLDLMTQGFIDLRQLQLFVLDEADRMLDMGFVHDVKKVLTKLPPKRQSLFFSATMPPVIVKLADTILVNPAKVEVTPVSSTADTIKQELFMVDKDNKKNLLIHILKDTAIKMVLVFTRTKHGADKVVKELIKVNIMAEAIHGNKSQNARQRALTNFKTGQTRVLIATDIAARGIDVDELTHVINFEMPNIPETYVHRIGRTGRAGAKGIALSFCDADEKEFLRDIQKLIGKSIPLISEHPFPYTGKLSEPKPKDNPRRKSSPKESSAKPSNRAGGDKTKRSFSKRRDNKRPNL